MEKAVLTEFLLVLAATMFGILVAIFGWLSNKLYEKLEYLNNSLKHIENTLRDRIHGVDNRITKIETEQTPGKIVSFRR